MVSFWIGNYPFNAQLEFSIGVYLSTLLGYVYLGLTPACWTLQLHYSLAIVGQRGRFSEGFLPP
jgi:hypothetical protein